MLHGTHSDDWMRGLDNFKTATTKMEATEIRYLQRMLRFLWNAMKSNETVLQEIDTTQSLINRISKHQAIFFGHVTRTDKLEHLVTTGMIKAKRS